MNTKRLIFIYTVIFSLFLLQGELFSQLGPISPIEGGGGVGAVTGPGSSTDESVVRWDGATGTLIQDSSSGPFVLDSGSMGVGTAAPASPLHVKETTATADATNGITIEQAGTGDAKLQVLKGAERWSIGTTGTGQLRFSNDAILTNSSFAFTSSGALFMTNTNNVPVIDLQGSVTNTIKIKESVDHAAGNPGDGNAYLWVKNDSPNVLVFTDDNGTDTILGDGGGGGTLLTGEGVVSTTQTFMTGSFIPLTGGSITLPEANRTYRIWYKMRVSLTSNSLDFPRGRMFNVTAGTVIPNSEALCVYLDSTFVDIQTTCSSEAYITTTVPNTVIRLEANGTAAGSSVFSASDGRTKIGFNSLGDGGATTVSLDQAYDFGGAGLGRSITADSGNVELNNSGTSVGITLQHDTGGTPQKWNITSGCGGTSDDLCFDDVTNGREGADAPVIINSNPPFLGAHLQVQGKIGTDRYGHIGIGGADVGTQGGRLTLGFPGNHKVSANEPNQWTFLVGATNNLNIFNINGVGGVDSSINFIQDGRIDFTTTNWATSTGDDVHIDAGAGSGKKLLRVVSSRRYKTNIVDTSVDSSGIYDLVAKDYNMKSDPDGGKEFGLVAEEVDEIFPMIVNHEADTGLVSSVQYDKLGILAIMELQNHQEIIDNLKDKIDSLELKLQELENRISNLE